MWTGSAIKGGAPSGAACRGAKSAIMQAYAKWDHCSGDAMPMLRRLKLDKRIMFGEDLRRSTPAEASSEDSRPLPIDMVCGEIACLACAGLAHMFGNRAVVPSRGIAMPSWPSVPIARERAAKRLSVPRAWPCVASSRAWR